MNQLKLEAKTYRRYKTRENMELLPSAGNHVTGAKREKTCKWYVIGWKNSVRYWLNQAQQTQNQGRHF